MVKLRVRQLLIALGAVMVVVSCDSSLVGPDGFLVPEPDLSLDPARVQVGGYLATRCDDRLDHLRSDDRWINVDIDIPGEAEPPDERDIQMIRAHGAWVYHIFNVRQVRARMVTSRIPDMVEETGVAVRTVPDPTRYDVKVTVGFNRGMTSDDRPMLEALGADIGRVSDDGTRFTAFVDVPDRSIPALLGRSDLRFLEHGVVYCIG